jgi:CheY-like chemotaxis protein
MSALGLKSELHDGTTIRAYLDELVLRKTPVQLLVPEPNGLPFETTISKVGRDTFTTTRTPPLPEGTQLNIAFMLDARRFTAPTRVMATGVFRIPSAVAQGERRQRFRAPFARGEGVEVFACERLAVPFAGGRTLVGRLVDLSVEGLRLVQEELAGLDGAPAPLRRGDRFDVVCIRGLPFTPTVQCAGVVAHVVADPDGPSVGFLLIGMGENDEKNVERVLAPRYPTTFGQAFPRMHRKTDLADQPGPPQPTLAAVKAPEVVIRPAAPPPPPPERPPRPEVTPVLRLRKAVRRILVISAGGDGSKPLAECLREEEFKQVFEGRSYLEAQRLAQSARHDLVLLDVRVGGHYGQMILEALRRHGLLLDVPVILVADRRDASVEAVAHAIGAVHIHEKRAPFEELLPVLYRLI